MAHSIRKITEHDKAAILEMGEAMHKESPNYGRYSYNPAKTAMLFDVFLNNPLCAAWIVEKDGECAGVLALMLGDMFFGDDKYVADMLTYLKPQYRNRGIFEAMVAMAENYAISKGAAGYHPSVSFGAHSDRVIKAYEKLGYEVYCHSLRKKL